MRESCISHKPKSLLLVIREDYFRLAKCDKVLSALLSVFEYWANGEISKNPSLAEESIDLGIRTISEIEKLTLWIATDKQIRTKLKELEELGFVSSCKGVGNHTAYSLHVPYLQQALDALDWSLSLSELRKQNPSRCTHTSGLLTEPPPVNKPHPSGLLTEPLYIEEFKNLIKECVRSADAQNTHTDDEDEVDFASATSRREENQSPVDPFLATNPKEEPALLPHVLPLESNIPANENNNHFHKTADRVRSQWEQTGVLPKIPMEIDAWAAIDLGQEVINAYRLSGRITTIKRGDIVPEFALYVSGQNKGKDVDYGYAYIKKLELDPRQWETLAALVLKWQTSHQTGNRSISIVREVKRRPLIELNLR